MNYFDAFIVFIMALILCNYIWKGAIYLYNKRYW